LHRGNPGVTSISIPAPTEQKAHRAVGKTDRHEQRCRSLASSTEGHSLLWLRHCSGDTEAAKRLPSGSWPRLRPVPRSSSPGATRTTSNPAAAGVPEFARQYQGLGDVEQDPAELTKLIRAVPRARAGCTGAARRPALRRPRAVRQHGVCRVNTGHPRRAAAPAARCSTPGSGGDRAPPQGRQDRHAEAQWPTGRIRRQ
jgi:hypothetical protein